MSRASLTITPSWPRRSRRTARTVGLRVAGRSGSSAVTTMWEVITETAPPSRAAANGTSSRAASTSASTSTTGSARWLSVAVSPCPGKCFTHAPTPARCTPRVQAATWAATSRGSAPKLRVPITGLSGSEFTSATGARSSVIPSDASSAPTRAPVSSVRARSSAAPSAAAPSTGLGEEVCSRETSPPSSSTATTARGLADRIAPVSAAVAAGPPAVLLPKRQMPPSPARSRSR